MKGHSWTEGTSTAWMLKDWETMTYWARPGGLLSRSKNGAQNLAVSVSVVNGDS